MNILYYGDNLEVLRQKLRDETIDLCYIDPPFNSKRNYFQIYNNIGKEDVAQAQAFIDTWTWNQLAMEGYQEIITNYQGRYTSQTIELLKGLKAVLGYGGLLAYLISMTQRVNEIQRVLKPTGSFYLHCDPTASHYLKLILDGVFCPRGGDFLNEIVWKRTSARSDSHKWNHIHDIVFFYSKSTKYQWNDQYTQYDQKYIDKFYKNIEPETGRRYTLSDLMAAGTRNGSSGKSWHGIDPASRGNHWKYTIEKLDELEKEGRIHFPQKKNGIPRYKRYFDEMQGVSIQSIVSDIPPLSAKSAEKLGYPTQKPAALLERIIQASSNEGDTVLDAYCGCGTTVAVAQRLNRHWIGIDITYQSIAVILKRLKDSFGEQAIAEPTALQLNGIPRDIESARALANKKDDRLRKEFEKWAILTYSDNQASINEKKGADKGVDGVAYMVTGKDTTARVIFQVKSGMVKRNDIATLNHDRQREGAEVAIFITLEPPTKPMLEEALSAGFNTWFQRNYPRIQIVTIQEIIAEGKRIDLPLNPLILKTAPIDGLDMQADLLEY